jgi:hypothetical protein
MPATTCAYCGLPFKVKVLEPGRRHFCCSGCALASRIPVNDTGLPASGPLVTALALGLGFFNQVLFWTLALTLVREGRAATAAGFARLSLGLGLVVWLASALLAWRSGARSWRDAAVLVATGALLALRSPAGAALGSAGWLLWLGRGWCKKKISRRDTNAG